MAVPHVSGNFADILDPTFQRIVTEEMAQLPDMISTLFSTSGQGARGDSTKWSSIGTLSDWDEFTGTVSYGSQSQGYDTIATHLEKTKGVQIERKLFDDDRFDVMNQRPKAMVASAGRTRQKDAASIFNKAFSVDTDFYVNSEGVALCSTSHTTTSGASTASGFDNLGTAALSTTAVTAARIQMAGYRDDQAELIDTQPDELWYPVDLFEAAEEINRSMGKVDTANNNVNVHEGKFNLHQWNRLTDTNNWFMADSSVRKDSLFWIDRISMEFAMIEDFDTLIAKWRGYMRYSFAWVNWRWCFGAQVS